MPAFNKKFRFRSLAATMAISFSTLIMVILFITSVLQMYLSFHAQRNFLKINQRLIAINTADAVDAFIHDKFIMLETASRRRDLTVLSEKEQEENLERLMGLEPAFRQLALFNSYETEIIKASRTAKPLLNYNRNELFNKTAHNERYIGPVYIDEATSEPMIIIAVPVTDAFGDYKGTLAADTNLKFMWDLMGQIRIGETGQAYVVEKQGYLIASQDIIHVLKREKLSYAKVDEIFNSEKRGFRERFAEISKGILNTNVITTSVRLKLTDWAVIVELPLKEAYKPIIMTLISSVLVMLLSIIIAIISGIYLARRFTKPLTELRDATEKIGKGQWALNIDTHSTNEIGDLTESFNKMVKDLEITTVSRDDLVKEVKERKQVEKILMESEQKMRAILMASPIGIGLVNNGRLEWANEALFSMAGYKQETLLGKSISMLYSSDEEYRKTESELFTGISGSETGHVETQWIREDGTVIDCVLGACPLDHENPEKGQILTAIDISESKSLQSKLMRAQKMEVIGTLAAGVAHDLNNILGGVVGYPELLLMDMPEDNPMRASLLTIKKAGERAAAIVQDLLTMARREVAIKEVVNLNDIVREFLKSPEYENILSFHPLVEVKTDINEDLLNIIGSPVSLSKVIMNLVSNAVESMTDGGVLSISTRNWYLDQTFSGYESITEGEYATLTVSDTGEGISRTDLSKIFEPFYTKKTMGRSGTGLGMSVVWGTLKDHNGYIDIISKEGDGTVFTLYFPVTREEATEKKPPIPVEVFMSKGESILVVDDVEEQRTILLKILQSNCSIKRRRCNRVHKKKIS